MEVYKRSVFAQRMPMFGSFFHRLLIGIKPFDIPAW
jgi:hypothetical protein